MVNAQRGHYDYWLLITVVLLTAIGVIMVYSASAVFSAELYGDPYFFLKKELVFVALGAGCSFVAARIPYGVWRKLVYPILGFSILLVILAYVPGFRSVASGAARWVHIGPITFQPSELMKVAMIFFLAYSLEKKGDKMQRFSVGILPHVAICGFLMLLVLGQRDFGTTFTMGVVMLLLLFMAGVRKTHLLAVILLALPLVYYAIAGVAYRRRRILTFLDPWSDRYGAGFQIIQSLVSFQQGGLFGRGLGEGQQKLFYLPEAHTDFIAAVLGEELGLIGVVFLIALFGMFAVRGLSIASKAPDVFGRYLALGITLLITWQALANLGVVMGILPTKGLVLPFISYGGSSMMVTLVAVGILMNVSSYVRPATAPQEEAGE